jgi:hypothetical protein
MPTWQAYADRNPLTSGTGVLVTGGHSAVRLQTGDLMSIETPDRNRVSGIIVDRTQGRLLLAIEGSLQVRLRSGGDSAFLLDFKLSDGFSRESWTVQ